MKNFSLNILIVEDDVSLALDLELAVEEMGYNVVAIVDNSKDAFKAIGHHDPDLILMDIELNGNLSGIQIAEKIEQLDIPVLYVTSLNDQAHFEKAKQTNYIGYIVKPVNKFTLRSSIETAFRTVAKQEKSEEENAFPYKNNVFFKKRGVLHRISIKSILYVSAADDYTITTTDSGDFISSLRLFEIQNLLEPFGFAKAHRSHLVNLNRVQSIDTDKKAIIIGEHEVPLSRTFKDEIYEKISYLK